MNNKLKNEKHLFYEIALLINKELYEEKIVNEDVFTKVEKDLLKNIKEQTE